MPIRAFSLFAAVAFGGFVCLARVSAAEIDSVSNWPAPLYWQTLPARSTPAHRGRIHREGAVKPAAATLPAPAVFVAMTPCRLVDTREGVPPFGSPAFYDGETRTIPIASSTSCTIPAGAVSYSLNIAVVPLGTMMRWLTAWDTGSPKPNAATLNDRAGLITSNSAVVPARANGSIDIFVTDATHVVIDINGYYAPQWGVPLTGTASAPALTFGDNATGLYSDTGGQLSIATGGSGRLTVRSDGDLDITGNIRKNGSLFVHNAGASLNTAVGLSALTNNKGENDTALGVHALWLNTTGDTNTDRFEGTREQHVRRSQPGVRRVLAGDKYDGHEQHGARRICAQ